MSTKPTIDAVIYAKDLSVVAAFYGTALNLTPLHTESTHVLFKLGDARLWVHAIPAQYAADIHIATPPALREDSAVKLSFPVQSIAAARDVIIRSGGGIADPERAWEDAGTWHLDAWDPEGNVIQLRGSP
jgi:predicted enzyme related to lactoylglutathione lyase